MKLKALILSALASSVLSGCWISPSTAVTGRYVRADAAYDNGTWIQPGHALAEMIAGVWVDGNGCEHWIIDDGIEGYMSTRWDKNGRPYCPAGNVPYTTKGFRRTGFFDSSMETNGRRNVPGEYTTIDGQHFVNGQGPENVAGPLPMQTFVPGADINETYDIGY